MIRFELSCDRLPPCQSRFQGIGLWPETVSRLGWTELPAAQGDPDGDPAGFLSTSRRSRVRELGGGPLVLRRLVPRLDFMNHACPQHGSLHDVFAQFRRGGRRLRLAMNQVFEGDAKRIG